MDIALAFVGLLLVGAILWEVFDDLFHPAARSALSDWIGRHLFGAFKTWPRFLPLAGPVTLLSVIATWIAGLVLGFALIYLHAFPQGFQTSTGQTPDAASRLLSVLYFSFETLVTLGYGDIVPRAGVARAVAAIEAMVGFGLLTASVSWIVLLYPALSRMRLLARSVAHLVHAEEAVGVSLAGADSDVVLNTLAREVTHVRIDLVHFPIAYYFVTQSEEALVSRWLDALMHFAADASSAGRPAHIRLAGATLDASLKDFAVILDQRFLRSRESDPARVFAMFAQDQSGSR